MKKTFDRDAVEFLPDALAIRHAELSWWMRHSIGVMCGAFLILCLLAALARIDVIVVSTGKIVSDHPTVALKPLERTVIKKIDVSVGEHVKAGQVLATLDPVFSQAEKERVNAEAIRLKARLERLRAEMAGSAYALSDAASAEEKLEYALFRDRRDFYIQKMASYTHEIESLTKTKKSLEENIALQRQRLIRFRQIEAMLNKAGSARAVSARDLKDAEITRMQLEADISDKKNSILITESQLLAKQNEKDAFATNWNIELAQDVVKTGAELSNAQKELAKAAQLASYVELRSPENAVVHDIAPISVGSAIREAETLFTLVPTDGRLEAEVEIKAEDIGKVKAGDTASIKVSAFPFQKYGVLRGNVRVISNDSFLTAREKEGPLFYKARIVFHEADDSVKRTVMNKLIPGMEVQADIQIGTRSVLEYILHPILKATSEALREP